MGGSKGTSSGDTGPVSTLSFIPGLLANAFLGTGLAASPDGFTMNEGGGVSDILGGREAQLDPNALFSNILDMIDPGFNPGVTDGQDFLNLGADVAEVSSRVGLENALPTLAEGLDTGFKPDLQPVIDAQQRNFFENIVPGIQERNVFANEGGAFGSDVTGQLFEAGKDMSVELGALETGLQSQAGQTRANLAQSSGTVLGQLQNVPFDAGFGSLDLGEQIGLQGTRAGRQAQLLQLLTGINPSQPIQSQSSRSKTSGGGI